MTDLHITTSWDDGHPLDLRLAEMLCRHGMAGTFYLPIANSEGRPVLDAGQMRQLAASGSEIGAHTHDHIRLDSLSDSEALRQIQQGKTTLEQRLGLAVTGFCYPGGRGIARAKHAVRQCGFTYARTTEMFQLTPSDDPYVQPTSVQVFPHHASALLRNWGRWGMGSDRLGMAIRCSRSPNLSDRLDMMLDTAMTRGGLLHVWGHSWEIEERNLWPVLDRFLARAAALISPSRRLSNAKAFERMP